MATKSDIKMMNIELEYLTTRFLQNRCSLVVSPFVAAANSVCDKFPCASHLNTAALYCTQMLDRQQALRCRAKLSNVLQQHHQRTIDSTCTICSKALEVARLSESEDKAILLLACLHGVHQSCFKEWRTSHRSESGDTVCPTCNAHVPVYDE